MLSFAYRETKVYKPQPLQSKLIIEIMEGRTSLVEVRSSVHPNNLDILNLRDSINLMSLPNHIHLESLRIVMI